MYNLYIKNNQGGILILLNGTDFLKIKELISESKEMDTESKSELLERLNKSNISGYGLNFVRSVEEIEKETYPFNKNKFIFVGENTEKEIFKGEEYTNNFLFEGDNLESLKVLRETHKNGIDVIYIDPPYNTGNKDFVYNDSFVSDDDGFRHSKWLSFMDKRLRLARELLTDDGVIFISIDDNEQAQLKLLCDQVFGENNFLATIHWRKNRKPHNAGNTMSVSHEFIHVYYKKNRVKLVQEYSKMLSDENGDYAIYPILKGDKKERIYTFKKGLHVEGKLEKGTSSSARNSKLNIEILDEPIVRDNILQNDIRIRGKYCLTDERGKLSQAMKDNKIYFNKNGIPKEKRYRTGDDKKVDNHYWDIDRGKNEDGNEEIKDIFNLSGDNGLFSYPKPKALLHKILTSVDKTNATVLDFFAGSGTTGHAVLELNKEDGGNRNFILCTNNENNICEEVTYQRLSKVINGYTTPKGNVVDGIPANLNYLKVEHIDTNEIYDFSEVDVIPYIELKEGVRYNCVDSFEYCESKNKYVFLVGNDSDMLSVEEFLERSDEKEVVIYCNNISVRNKYVNTPYYLLFKSINEKDILSISKS